MCAVVVAAAVGGAAKGSGEPPLTEGQLATSTALLNANIYAAESFLAKAYMFEHKYTDVKPLMEGLVLRLAHTEATLEGHDLGTADPITPLKTAESDFTRAVAEY